MLFNAFLYFGVAVVVGTILVYGLVYLNTRSNS